MNKTELTKRKLHGFGFNYDNSGILTGIMFKTSPNIRKIRKLFPTIQILDECFSEDGFGDSYILCRLSSDFKHVSKISYVIDEFKYEYKTEINGEDIFNDEELNIIKNEVKQILDNLQYMMTTVDLRMSREKLRKFLKKFE